MYYVSVYNKERKRWELSWEGEAAHEYSYLEDALNSYALAVKLEGLQNVMLLSSVSVSTELTAKVLYPESYNLPKGEDCKVTV